MLTDLVVERLGVIDRVELSLGEGSIAITGETGAGKTLVVAAAALLLGARADASLIRTGAKDAQIQGRFLIGSEHPVVPLLQEQGVLDGHDEDGSYEVVVSRTISIEAKRNRIRINGVLLPLGVLAEVAGALVEIAGQNQHGRVAHTGFQRSTLDRSAEAEELADEVATEFRAASQAAEAAERLRRDERERMRELDMTRAEVEQLERLAPIEGESERLTQEIRRADGAEALREAITEANMVLGGERGAVDLLAAAEQALARVALHDDALRQVRDRIEAARHEVSDINDGLSREPIEYDDASLTEKRARLAQLASMKRRYGQDETEMLAYLASARTRVQELESAEDDAAALEEEAAAHLKLAEDLADRLTSQRKAAAERLALEVTDRLTALALPEARFEVGLTPCELSEHGAERVSFLFTANPGESSRPLAKVASGGELSRVSLAIHLTAYAGSARTLIFDEVDAGVGGRAATEVGRALSRLARTREVQVIVVTHLPQVAAFASEHHRVTKRTSGGHTDASVDLVEGDERVAELSRMMAGVPGSATAQEHARELLTLASGRTK